MKSTKEIRTKVVGVTHRNDDGSSRQKLVKSCRPGEILFLQREPQNRFDRNAVKVLAKRGLLGGYKQLGYISKDLAVDLRPLLDSEDIEGTIFCSASQVTGGEGMLWWKKNFGLNILIKIEIEEPGPRCPWCAELIEPAPKRGRKCPHCGSKFKVKNGKLIPS